MSRQTRRARRRHARYLVAIAFAFGCVNSLWGAQAASADVIGADITSVTVLDGTGSFISNEGTTPDGSSTGLTSLPDTTVALPDTPVLPPVVQIPATVGITRGELTFTNSDCTDPAGDYASGKLQADAQAYVEKLLSSGWSIRINCITSGHAAKVAGTSEPSLHASGEAFDIDQINGQAVSPTSPESNRFYRWLKAQDNSILPWEVGGPHVPAGRLKIRSKLVQPFGPFFTNPGHTKHWHFGFKANSGSFANPSAAHTSPVPAPASPQTPFVVPPPSVKEEKPQPAPVAVPSGQPDPNGDNTPVPDQIVPVEIPPAVDIPVAQPESPMAPVQPSPEAAPADPIMPEVQLPPSVASNDAPAAAPSSSTPAQISIDQAVLTDDYNRMKADNVLQVISGLEAQYNLPSGIGLALASRETHGRNELGDGGHGHCYIQIDDRSHGDWLDSHDWHDPSQCFAYGLSILAADRDSFDGDLFKALAAYNSGPGNVRKAIRNGDSPESRTAHGDYASDVLARADFFRSLLNADTAAPAGATS